MLILLIIIFWLLHCCVFLIRTMISKIFSRVHVAVAFNEISVCHFAGAFGWAIDGCGMVWASPSRCLLRHGWECASFIGFCWRRGKCATQGTSREGGALAPGGWGKMVGWVWWWLECLETKQLEAHVGACWTHLFPGNQIEVWRFLGGRDLAHVEGQFLAADLNLNAPLNGPHPTSIHFPHATPGLSICT